MKMSINSENTERGGAGTSPVTLFTSADQKKRCQSVDDSVIEDVINRLEAEDFELKIKERNFIRERSSSSMSEVELETDQDDVISDLVADAYAAAGRLRSPQPGPQRIGRTKSLYGATPNVKFGPKAGVSKSQACVLTIQDPGSQKLTWHKPPLSVLVIKKICDDSVVPPFIELVTWLLQDKAMVVFVESKSLDDPCLQDNKKFEKVKKKLCTFTDGEDDLTDKIDFIICLGGDGTLIYASSLFQGSVPPVLAFHLGSLGFLTPHDFSPFKSSVTQVLKGNVSLILRSRLKCSISRSTDLVHEPVKGVESKQHILVLNEVVVDRGPCPYLCNVDLYIEHRYVTSVQGDGLIISTPTGSTAYAAAAGASMIHPNVPAILIAPVCPHSLSFRPIVVPAGVEIKLCISPEARNTAWVSFDGRNRQEIRKGDTVRISTSIYPVPSICSNDQICDWFDSLAECLHWNVRKQQKAFRGGSSVESLTSSPEQSTNGRD